MKRLFTLMGIAASLSLAAQRNTAVIPSGIQMNISAEFGNISSNSREIGDTIFYFDGNSFSWADGTVDEAAFTSEILDLDGLPINANIAPAFDAAEGYTFYYFLDTTYTPDGAMVVDTGNYFGCFSWFTTVAQADDWFIFGPVNVPASGATLRWQHRIPDNDYRDGYEVLVGFSPESFNFTDAIYEVTDNDPITDGHTVWTPQEAIVSTVYNGQPTYFAFHHDATDMFTLYLDDIALVESGSVGIQTKVQKATLNTFPNPSSNFTTLNYHIDNSASVRINVIDAMGKVLSTSNEGNKQAGKYSAQIATADLAAGIYFVNLVIDGATYSTKITVAH